MKPQIYPTKKNSSERNAYLVTAYHSLKYFLCFNLCITLHELLHILKKQSNDCRSSSFEESGVLFTHGENVGLTDKGYDWWGESCIHIPKTTWLKAKLPILLDISFGWIEFFFCFFLFQHVFLSACWAQSMDPVSLSTGWQQGLCECFVGTTRWLLHGSFHSVRRDPHANMRGKVQ